MALARRFSTGSANTSTWAGLFPAFVLICGWACLSAEASPNAYVRLPISEGNDLLFVPVSFGQGPSHGRIGQIVEDHTGFLWFGTKDGLKRYDGYRIRDFRADPKNPGSMSGVSVNALFTDHSGSLWVAPDEHLDRYDASTETFAHIDARPGRLEPPVNDIEQDRAGMIWFATSRGLSRLDPKTGKTTQFRHESNDPTSLTSDFLRSTFEQTDGTFWVASSVALDVFDRRSGRVTQRFSLFNPLGRGAPGGANPSVHLFEDHAGVLWVASARDGLARIDPHAHRLIFVALDRVPEPGAQTGANTIYEDREGTLWIGTNGGGLLKLDRDRTKIVRYRNNPADPDSLSADQVLVLFADHEDGIWIGTNGGGVLRIPNQAVPFRRYRHEVGKVNSLPADFVSSVFEDSQGMVWVGTTREVTRIDRRSGRYTRFRIDSAAASNSDVSAINEDRAGYLWFGTRGAGLVRFDPLTGRSEVYRHRPGDPESLSHDTVFALHIDHRGRLWVGTEDGLNTFDPHTKRFRVYKAPGVNPNRERAIAEDATGSLWLATWYSGVHRFDPETGRFTLYRGSESPVNLSNDAVAAILVDRSGTVWAGTENGLNRFEPATGTFKTYDTRDGLPNNNINGIVEDDAGDLWITTSNGLSNFDLHRTFFRNYYRSDGVLGDFTTAWRSPTGELFFGSFTGLTSAWPVKVARSVYVPPVVLTGFQLSDKSAPIGGESPLKQAISLTSFVTLSHTQNSLSLEFSALSYASPQRTRYRYRLEGLEKDWSEVDSTQRVARYTTLPPGYFAFRVQGRTSQGTWTENRAQLHIRILPPWWETRPFQAICAGLFCLGLWGAYRFRVRQMTGRLNLRFEERLTERTRIAGELHDTLLQGFLSASMQLDVAADLLPPESPVRAQLNHILAVMARVSTEGRNAVQGLRSPDGDSLQLEQAFAQIAEEFDGETSDPPVDFRIAVEGRSRPLHPVFRDEVYRIGREAVINAFRHSQAKTVEVEIEYSEKYFRLVVRDNGSGIDPEVLRSGREGHWGLHGMRERSERIGAQLRLWSRAEGGTTVEMTVPGKLAFRSTGKTDLAGRRAVSWRLGIDRLLRIPVWFRINTQKVVRKNSRVP